VDDAGKLTLRGFGDDARRHPPPAPISCLGDDSIIGWTDGQTLHSGQASTPAALAALSVSGRCLVAVEGGHTLHLYATLADALASHDGAAFALDSPAVSLHAGAGHFLIETADHALLGLGDNRFGQLGTAPHPRPVETARALELFDDMPLRSIGVGDHHAAVVDESGGCVNSDRM